MSKTTNKISLEFPEIASLAIKLSSGESLSEHDKFLLKELSEFTGWSIDEIIEELKRIDADSSERAKKYREFFEKLYKEAVELVEKDTVQAAEKLWGAIVALIKIHASIKGVFVEWTHDKLYNYVTRNVEEKHRKLFRDLLKAGEPLHFYEKGIDYETFKDCWKDAVELVEKVKELVYASLK
jgi:predicted hydrocarbon binding protein